MTHQLNGRTGDPNKFGIRTVKLGHMTIANGIGVLETRFNEGMEVMKSEFQTAMIPKEFDVLMKKWDSQERDM